jgi:3',5'-cyclic AMP phosphodiesterase CpdA
MIRIAQLTDIHVPDFSDFRRRDFLNKRVTGFVNHRYRRGHHHDPTLLDAAVTRLVADRPDLVIVSGDLSNVALRSEWNAARACLQPLADAGIRIGVVPGNHDEYLYETRGQFEDIFHDFQHADSRTKSHYPFVMRVGHVSVLMFNSAVPTAPMMAYGRINYDQIEAGRQLAEIERDQGQRVIAVIHHHPIPAPHKRVDRTRNLRNASNFRHMLCDAGIEVLMHGHNHWLQTTRLRDNEGPIVIGLSSTTYTIKSPDERVARIALYEFEGNERTISLSPYDAEANRFGAWQRLDTSNLPVFPLS